MSNYNLLFGITGSIAAYKSAYLISKLVQNGFEVKVVATESALKFIGSATLEGLTGNQVYTDNFKSGEMMNHINLIKWADAVIICPASANTINKLASGIADNLLTSLFLAHDWHKPFLIAPAMNTNMYEHPATKSSLQKLNDWGALILPTAEGYLACGDIGKGKLLEPDEIYEYIINSLNKYFKKRLNILITAGGTKENIDGVRFISNISTGNTASKIADFFIRKNHNVTYLHSFDAKIPSFSCNLISFTGFYDLNSKIQNLLGNENFDVVIHNAAVSDYSPVMIEVQNEKYIVPLNSKINSEYDEIILHLKKNFKILDRIKNYSRNNNLFLIAFKFTNTLNEKERDDAVRKCFERANCDLVVNNDLNNRKNNIQNYFDIYDKEMKKISVETVNELSQKIEEIILQKTGDKL